ncbi:MAG: prephenate dehydrogenase [Oscillospiraceae bacterium]|nr:prephenate dehydrogenase [Oscillospiraceae bacterium]
MKIAVVGLGIIGGSYCKAIKKYTNHYVIGINRSPLPLEKAYNCGAIDKIGTINDLGDVDLVILGVYPGAAVQFIRDNGDKIKKGAVVTDTSGIKTEICSELTGLSHKHGFTFVGVHPMAGKEKNGFDVSDADLYKGASCIVIPCDAKEEDVKLVSDFNLSLGFGGIKISTPEEHDRMISFTSQLPHILACAYVLSPNCMNHKGFSAGSYRDVSRVANINAELWSELFLDNKKPLLKELDTLISNIQSMEDAISNNDKEKLMALLSKGHEIKEALGE